MSCEPIALAVICVLAAIIIYQYHNKSPPVPPTLGGGVMPPVGMHLAPPARRSRYHSGGPELEKGHSARRWSQSSNSIPGLAYAAADPDLVSAAEREAWSAPGADADVFATDAGSANYCADPAINGDPAGMDYARYTADIVIDPRMRDNHRKWVEEMGPWSGAVRSVDNMDEALEADISFVGLQRPQGVPVRNPTQVTELGPEILADNHNVFCFNG